MNNNIQQAGEFPAESLAGLGGPAVLNRLATPEGSEAWLAVMKKAIGEGASDILEEILMENHLESQVSPAMPEKEKETVAKEGARTAWDRVVYHAGQALSQSQPTIWDNQFVRNVITLAKVEMVTGELQDSTLILDAYTDKAMELINNWKTSNPPIEDMAEGGWEPDLEPMGGEAD